MQLEEEHEKNMKIRAKNENEKPLKRSQFKNENEAHGRKANEMKFIGRGAEKIPHSPAPPSSDDDETKAGRRKAKI